MKASRGKNKGFILARYYDPKLPQNDAGQLNKGVKVACIILYIDESPLVSMGSASSNQDTRILKFVTNLLPLLRRFKSLLDPL